MKRLLHIIAAPRQEESRTLKVTASFLETFKGKYPDCYIDELNVMTEELPELTVKVLYGKYVLMSGKDLTDRLKREWNPVLRHIERFLSAEAYLLSAPMWNFNIPYPLKHYIDIIVQPRLLFRYTAQGVEGLARNRKMAVITSRGGKYIPETPSYAYDFQEPYLRTIFGFVGITDITFVNFQGTDSMKPEALAKSLEEAKMKAGELANNF